MREPSKVLYISHTSPLPAKIGPSRRHYHILLQLSRFYDTHLLTLGTKPQAEMFRNSLAGRVNGYTYAVHQQRRAATVMRKVYRTMSSRCDFLPVLDPMLRYLCSRITSTASFDAIILSTVLLRGLPLPETVPLVGDTHNVDSDVLTRTSVLADSFTRRQYAKLQARYTFEEERRSARKVDLLLASSDRDRELFEKGMGVHNVSVIPNGIDPTEFSGSRTPGQADVILFTGLMSYYPNQQAIRWFLHEMFPRILRKRPKAQLVIAGAAPPAWVLAKRSSSVEVTGAVPDMRPYFEQARVVIVPLQIGGGTRVKILEAQAMARPVVSTSLGAEGLDVCHGESIMLADDAESFSKHIIHLLTDSDLASKIGANGRENAVLRYDWNRIGERLESVLRQQLGLRPRELCIQARSSRTEYIERLENVCR